MDTQTFQQMFDVVSHKEPPPDMNTNPLTSINLLISKISIKNS
jgi:hypothetical protein